MPKLVFCVALVGGVIFAAPLLAEQVYNPRPQYGQALQGYPAAGDHRPPLRWRPMESDTESVNSPSTASSSLAPSTVFDYTDEPFGLPRGTYRKIEQRHTITPHLEGYRFRPIDPGEQQRNRERNQSSASKLQQDSYSSGSAYGGGLEAGQQGMRRSELQFRPDARLDKKARGAPSRYAFPAGSGAPLYRPR